MKHTYARVGSSTRTQRCWTWKILRSPGEGVGPARLCVPRRGRLAARSGRLLHCRTRRIRRGSDQDTGRLRRCSCGLLRRRWQCACCPTYRPPLPLIRRSPRQHCSRKHTHTSTHPCESCPILHPVQASLFPSPDHPTPRPAAAGCGWSSSRIIPSPSPST
jgi:hypothetical protein